MSAIPTNLYSAPKVKGLKSIKTTSIALRPVNVSSSTELSYDTNNQLTFHIPANQISYISPKQTFLSFVVEAVRDVGDSTTFAFQPGFPVFNRVSVKTSSGQIICDIDDYNILQKLLQNINPDYEANKSLVGDYRSEMQSSAVSHLGAKEMEDLNVDVTASGAYVSGGTATNARGITIQHNILAGIFDQEHYLPLGMFSGSAGHALEITMYLNKPEMCMYANQTTAYTGSYKYRLLNAHMQVELVQLPESVTQT